MAKIFKISGYFVDLNGNFDASGLAVSLRQSFDLIDHHIEVEEVDLPGEWDDDHPLNQCDCPVSECEKYFEKTEPVDEISVEEMRKALERFCDTVAECEGCLLCAPVCRCGCGTQFAYKRKGSYDMTDDEIRDAYKTVFR